MISRWLRLGGTAVLLGVLATGCFTERKNEGARLYKQTCANCHGEQGQGLRRLIPPLAGADYLKQHRAELPCLIRRGYKGQMVVNGVDYNQVMPGNEPLTDSQITNILNYIQTAWGNKGEVYTIREVSQQLGACNGSDGQ
ncbi:c-type cytochrome [Hymenobacter jejuensis]|uniref:Cytochrome c n=1 Tax=Hymenobacter jejuensis TaxID=2502781 RepID=A0A5B8A4P9_9BACT|nr:cytochrome c [Hymenobacter jejuensis]QDA61696.1 cytochrome c [Hymenobacter jejuensis]